MIHAILYALKSNRFLLENEKELQAHIADHLAYKLGKDILVRREVVLGPKDIIDFLIEDIGIEVKIKGSKRAIFRQCARYCGYDQVGKLILVTNVSMGFPTQLNGKDCFIINLGKAWL